MLLHFFPFPHRLRSFQNMNWMFYITPIKPFSSSPLLSGSRPNLSARNTKLCLARTLRRFWLCFWLDTSPVLLHSGPTDPGTSVSLTPQFQPSHMLFPLPGIPAAYLQNVSLSFQSSIPSCGCHLHLVQISMKAPVILGSYVFLYSCVSPTD